MNRAALHAVVERTAEVVCPALDLGDPAAFPLLWAEERDRQFREEVPRFREVDLSQRARRVIARLRGAPATARDAPWDDEAAGALAPSADVALVVNAYSRAFVATIPAPPASSQVIEGLANRGFRLAILSNWPLAATIDRFAESAGWLPWLAGIYVSERIGSIKPDRVIFDHAASALQVAPGSILHVGDDWVADVVGARGAGWRAAYLRGQQGDTPLPVSTRHGDIVPDLELDSLPELGSHLADPTT